MHYVLGKDLEIGDDVDVFWQTGDVEDGHNVATLLEVRPYEGKLAHLWEPEVARIGTFTGSKGPVDMTIEPQQRFIRFRQLEDSDFEVE